MPLLNKKFIFIIFLQLFYSSLNLFGYSYSNRRWTENNMPTFYVNQTGTPDCSSEFTAISSAFQTWNSVTTTYLNLQYGGTTTDTDARTRDSTNLLMWVESDWENLFPGSSAIAVATTWYNSVVDTIHETDICFNGEDHQWTTTGTAGRHDVQNIATHEIGHTTGLGDLYGGGDSEKTMYGYASTGETKKRSLHEDDIAGIRYVYFDPQTSGTLSENQNWNTNLNTGSSVTLTGNLVVPTGKTLTIESGYEIDFDSYAIASSGGSIILESGVETNYAQIMDGASITGLFPTIQLAVNAVATLGDGTIYLFDNTYTGNVSITSKSDILIDGVGTNSSKIDGTVTVTNSDDIEFQDLQIKNNNKIYVSGGDGTRIENVYFPTSSQYVNAYNNPDVDLNAVTSTYGGTDGAIISNSTGGAVYVEIENFTRAIRLSNSSSFDVFSSDFCDNTYDIYAVSNSDSYCVSNVYSSSTSTYGDVTIVGTPTYCGIYKMVSNPSLPKSKAENDPSETAIERDGTLNSEYMSLWKTISDDRRENENFNISSYSSQFISLINKFKSYVLSNPDDEYSKIAVIRIAQCFRRLGDFNGLKGMVSTFINNPKLSALKPYVERQMINYYLKTEEFDKALATTNDILSMGSTDIDLICEMLYEKGTILRYHILDDDNAKECFEQIIINYPENSMVHFAKTELELMGATIPNENIVPVSESNGKFELTSYPNPFNPTTNIAFNLPQTGMVTIKVYDILGAEVAVLINEIRSAGKHNIQFNGKDLASGMYITTMRVTLTETGKQISKTKKILLTK